MAIGSDYEPRRGGGACVSSATLMPSGAEHRAAFDRLAGGLKRSVALTAQALAVRDDEDVEILEHGLDHALERLAVFYGLGTFENYSTAELITTAMDGEATLAEEYRRAAREPGGARDDDRAALHAGRARGLRDVARRARNVTVGEPADRLVLRRGVHIDPLTPEAERILVKGREAFVRWGDGAVASIPETTMQPLRDAGASLHTLYLGVDELYDDADRRSPEQLEQEFARRLEAVQVQGTSAGSALFDEHVRALLLTQSMVLRNLRRRLRDEHPVAHMALAPIVVENRRLIADRFATAPVAGGEPPAAPVAASDLIEHEEATAAEAATWAQHAEADDAAGMHAKFRALAQAGTPVERLRGLGDAC